MRSVGILIAVALWGCKDKSAGDTGPVDSDVVVEEDGDSDGYLVSDGDCNDSDASVYPGGIEICDGIDNNCDGAVDEGVTTTYFADEDADGFGDSSGEIEACDQPSGYVSIPNDCDDSDADSYPGAAERCDGVDNDCDKEIDEEVLSTWYADADGDGFGDEEASIEECDPPARYVADSTDCDDLDPSAYPDATEVCDEADNNCDGTVDEGVTETYYQDTDNDNYGVAESTVDACGRPVGYAGQSRDCDDVDDAVNPVATEVCDDIDNDCDFVTDEDDAADVETFYADSDSDGFGDDSTTASACTAPSGYVSDNTDCDDGEGLINPAATELCNGYDDDCDGDIDSDATDKSTYYADNDGDGYGGTSATEACEQPSGYATTNTDCDDGESLSNPGQTEVCDDIDNDCDGDTDEGLLTTYYIDSDSDGYGNSAYGTTACTAPSGYVVDDTDCNDGEGLSNPGQTEVCDDIDNDCDGDTDEGLISTYYIDYDGDGYGSDSYTVDTCSAPTGYVDDDSDCNDAAASAYPGASEYCDGLDNDCDGDTDESGALDEIVWYADGDIDGFGDPDTSTSACEQPSGYTTDDADCDDGNQFINPDADELCDGDDNNCDGDVDEDSAVDAPTWYADSDGDGFGDPLDAQKACTEPIDYTADNTDCDDDEALVNPDGTEECGDGLDNDCDGESDNGELGEDATCAAVDCDDLLNNASTPLGDGVYWVDPTGADPYEVYCDMTNEGGGWTLLAVFSNNDGENWNAHSANWVSAGEFGSSTSPSTNADAKSQAFDDMPVDELMIMQYPSDVDVVTQTSCVGGSPLITVFQRDSEYDSNCAYSCAMDYVQSPWSGQSLQDSSSLRFRCTDNDGWTTANGYYLGSDDNSMITTLNNGSYHDYNFGLGAGYGSSGSSQSVDWDATTSDAGDDSDTTQILLLGR